MADKPQPEMERINAELDGQPFRLAVVGYEQLEFLEKNARFMTHETFSQLVENIKRDGGLSSVPFCLLTPKGKYRVLSGNHRLQAAHAAGFDRYLVLYTDKELSRQEQVAVQLSHNALTGKDDPAILRDLWSELDEVALKFYSGLDDKLLNELEDTSLEGLLEPKLDFRTVQFIFLPEEVERLREVFDKARAFMEGDEAFLARFADFDRLMDALAKSEASYNVRNSATGLLLVLDVFERHQEDLTEGWTIEGPNRSWVPLSSIFGTDYVPLDAARVVQRAVEKLLSRESIPKRSAWRALELWAADYLAGA